MNHRIRSFSALAAGVLFGLGLVVSGMTDPNKVMGFLDFTGEWDPTLAFVLGGAMVPNLFVFARILRRSKPVFDDTFHLPTKSAITVRLVVGSVLFGIGWGLSGYCPGPALVATAGGGASVLVFTVSMLVGTGAYRALVNRRPLARLTLSSELSTRATHSEPGVI